MNRGLLRGAARLAGVVCLAQPTPSRFSASASASTPVVRTHLLQLAVSGNKQKDIAGAVRAIGRTAGASDLVVLPECWNCPYSNDAFGAYAEPLPAVGTALEAIDGAVSPSTKAIAEAAKAAGAWVVAGSIPERAADGKLFNACVVFDAAGAVAGIHRKVHLFDIDVPGKITFRESDTLTRGDAITVVDTPFGGLGVGICYDMRFAEQAAVMRERGAKIIAYPGAFNTVTGPAHYELLARSRANDNQLYVLAVAPARAADGYQSWGHSTAVDPWGAVMATAGEGPAALSVELDMARVDEVRESIPTATQKRDDLYDVQGGR